MLFKSKPHIYLRFYDKSIHYLALDTQHKVIVDKGELVFDTPILIEGRVENVPLVKTRLDALVKEKKWKNAKSSILLPDDFVTIRHEDIPVQLSPSEAKDYVDLHVNTSIRLPFDNPKVDFEIIERNEETQRIVLVAYPSEEVRQYWDTLKEAGLKPEAADFSALSVYRVIKETQLLGGNPDDHHLVLQWHPLDMSITVFSNDVPHFNRHSRFSTLNHAWSLTNEGQWVWTGSDEELDHLTTNQLDGLERFMDFYRFSVLNGKGSIASVILTGSYPNMIDLEGVLNERFDLPIHVLVTPMNLKSEDASLYGLSLKSSKKTNKTPKLKHKKVKVKQNETLAEEGEV